MAVPLVQCDLDNTNYVKKACRELISLCPKWDILVMCPGSLNPVGAFAECSFDDWEKSLKLNFTSQLRMIHGLLPQRNTGAKIAPVVLLFAGGGTNSAPVNYSAYTISKIGLIKMTELLDAEIPDTRFAIIGPGWVKTKIHETTLAAGKKAGANYQSTKEHLAGDTCTSMETVLDCCDWVVDAPREVISGRNISVVYDKWGTAEMAKILAADPNMYKLRRYGNDRLVKK
jgi:NAD(P)-dependent dehydrogenase (short-subunit alcohol dehydrogenase family)